MKFKYFAGAFASMLMLVYLGPVVIKLRDPALTIVALIGVVLMLTDLSQSLRSAGD